MIIVRRSMEPVGFASLTERVQSAVSKEDGIHGIPINIKINIYSCAAYVMKYRLLINLAEKQFTVIFKIPNGHAITNKYVVCTRNIIIANIIICNVLCVSTKQLSRRRNRSRSADRVTQPRR